MVSVSKLLRGGFLLVDQSIYSDVAVPQQAAVEQFNVIRYLSGAAPYIQNPGLGIPQGIPENCKLEQVQMLGRHGERYPTTNSGNKFKEIYDKLMVFKGTYKDEFSFLNDESYSYFVENPAFYEHETTPENSEGTFAGTKTAFRHGETFRKRYGELYDDGILPIFTSNSGRCFTTSEYFAKGFLGAGYTADKVKFSILAEEDCSTCNHDLGANSLTPRNACTNFDSDENQETKSQVDKTYLKLALERFKISNPQIPLVEDDVANLFKYCAYEINVSGQSPMCNIFTNVEYLKYSYSESVAKYYSTGPGHRLSEVIGSVMLKASVKLLKEDNPSNKIWLSFSHDTDIEMYLAALGIISPEQDLTPSHQTVFPNPYSHSDLVPQGARIYTEKYSCQGTSYIRYILNDAVIPLRNCSSGPGYSCSLGDFISLMEDRLRTFDFGVQCDAKDSQPNEISFYWDYDDIDYNAPLVNQ
ncbi:repressible acid phosphatase [[Candida] railenensis]|uniref:Repressible acid phosphatase n=1 Tax=[Candida] railenensis TaxID=45579 RepID=A0A9P0QR74_9ASCO|nr:repressible acid phosphatase [[Candida] railenensis]